MCLLSRMLHTPWKQEPSAPASVRLSGFPGHRAQRVEINKHYMSWHFWGVIMPQDCGKNQQARVERKKQTRKQRPGPVNAGQVVFGVHLGPPCLPPVMQQSIQEGVSTTLTKPTALAQCLFFQM